MQKFFSLSRAHSPFLPANFPTFSKKPSLMPPGWVRCPSRFSFSNTTFIPLGQDHLCPGVSLLQPRRPTGQGLGLLILGIPPRHCPEQGLVLKKGSGYWMKEGRDAQDRILKLAALPQALARAPKNITHRPRAVVWRMQNNSVRPGSQTSQNLTSRNQTIKLCF